ncbi:Na+/H+ antiporter subunit G [Sphingomonas sp. Leaf242]|uniref:Na+/H+ antiporter subunit G n=1 Tax=Sphingomonas sp. Leaf242 TaxID=1736304 RepID=UPI000715DF02|nr:Na+/H+ antiporter subunit G [Sphingomonas sp. Leaf242]KQO09165.1 cation:proton antiporter [Sphingomonas sp. Leaf242]
MIDIFGYLVVGLILLGAAFLLIGSWGLVRLPSTMERLHGPTMATTLGVGSLVLASMLRTRLQTGTWSMHELLIMLFLFITTPVSANMIAKVHLHRQRMADIIEPAGIAGEPPNPDDGDWATFEVPRPSIAPSTADLKRLPGD